MQSELPDTQAIYSVSQFTTETRLLLEENFQTVWILGEISNLARPSSGHCYFSLKDERAQIRAALFRNTLRRINFTPENGQQVLARATVSLYEPRGDFQIIIQHLQLAGEGALQIAFEKLKNKLAEEGLFDESHKQTIPTLPRQIGVITSATGAAIRDILTVLKRRFASIPVIIYQSPVQGEMAAPNLVKAIQTANQRQECDVLILARGGGSLEDLWPFNEESVARAIFKSLIPIVSGVGHEVDFTIADFVADVRAATPSAAAERVSPDGQEWLANFKQLAIRLTQAIARTLGQARIHLEHLQKRLRHPGIKLREQMQRLDQLEQQFSQAIKFCLAKQNATLNTLVEKFQHHHPATTIKNLSAELNNLNTQLNLHMQHQLQTAQQTLGQLAGQLNTLSPLKTLERGYALVLDSDNQLITSVAQAKPGDVVKNKLRDGALHCTIDVIDQ